MANEMKFTYKTAVVLEASGASCGSAAFVAANDTSLSSANHYDYPMADFALTCDFAAAVTAGVYVNLYRQDMDIDAAGTGDSPVPATTYKQILVGQFVIPSGQSASAIYPCPDVPLSHICQFYIENGSIQTISAGWKLDATPKTFVPA